MSGASFQFERKRRMAFYDELTDNQNLYSMYFIAKYESSWSWDGHNYSANVNYGDPFTVGIMQWAGSHACEFLTRMQSGTPNAANLFADLPATWRQAVEVGASADLWGGYTMTQADVDVWCQAVANHLDEMKAYAQWYWCVSSEPESLAGELDAMASVLGMEYPDAPTLDDIRKVYFYLARYHNTGSNMRRIYQQCGLTASLAEIRDATLEMYRGYSSWGIYGAGWTNAINDNYELLSAWDGDTVPDFGQVAGYGINDGNSSGSGGTTGTPDVVEWVAKLRYVDMFGDSLVLHMEDGSGIICDRANGGNCFVPVSGIGGQTGVIGSGNTSSSNQSPASDATEIMRKVMAFYKADENKYGYSLTGDYDNPDSSGVTNCSAYIHYVARKLAPDSEMANMSYSYTGVMAAMGEYVADGTNNSSFPYDLAMPGDVLLVNWNWYNPDYDHVELYLGTTVQGNDTGSELWGAGSAPCPHKNGGADGYIKYSHDWMLRRISWE